MNATLKVDNYYNKIYEEVKKLVDGLEGAFVDDIIEAYNEDNQYIKKAIRAVVDTNNDHLLTEAFIKFLVKDCYDGFGSFDFLMYEALTSLSKEEGESVTVCKYLLQLYKALDNDGLDDYPLTDFEKEVINDLYKEVQRELFSDYSIPKDYFLKRDIYLSIATHVLINELSLDEFYIKVNDYNNNWQERLDEIGLQVKLKLDWEEASYSYPFKNLFKYVVKQMDNNKREIR